jgi:hypothetical protein
VAALAASSPSSSNPVGREELLPGEERLFGPDDEVSSNHQHGQARQATATATPPTQTLAVATVGQGTLTSSPPGIACPPSCRHAFPAGTPVRLVARPANGWHLLSWEQACTGPAGCMVRMRGPRGPRRARARFVADTAALGAAFARYLRARTSRVGIAVYDATTATTYAVNQAATFQTASIVKAQILGAVLHQAQAQRRPLTSFERANLAAMIQRSDNHAATTLWHLLGGASSVAAFDRLVPMPATTPHPAWGLTTTTAADNVRLLRAFAFPTATLTPRHRAYGLSLLEQVVGEGQEDQLSALGFLVNVCVLWNTLYTARALEAIRAEGTRVLAADVARLSPLGFDHLRFLGRYKFSLPEPVRNGQLRPPRTPTKPTTRAVAGGRVSITAGRSGQPGQPRQPKPRAAAEPARGRRR